MNRKTAILQWIQIVIGLLIFSFGVHLSIFANIGLAPWDCLGMGIARHTPLNYGVAMMMMAVVILGIDILLKEQVGYGTVIDALLTGNMVQMFNDLNPFPLNNGVVSGIAIMVCGFVFMSLGMYVYMSAQQCCGPRDALLVGIGKRMPRVPIGVVEILLWGIVLAAGYVLGGPVGIGTLISTFGAGLIMQVVYHFLHFEPRRLVHKNLAEVTKCLTGQSVAET